MKSLFTKALLLMLSLCLMSFMTVAQGTIKGKIVDSQTKEPLVGATVMLEGTSEGVAADLLTSSLQKPLFYNYLINRIL